MSDRPWLAAYPPGVPADLDVPRVELWGLLARAAEESGDRPAVRERGVETSYASLSSAARRCARVLAADTGPVLLALPNSLAFLAWFFGAQLAGRAVVAQAPDSTDHEVAPALDQVRPRAIVCRAEQVALWRRRAPGATVLTDALPDVEPLPAPDTTDPERVAVYQFTSGTTGEPKAACMSHRNLVANALQNDVWFGWTADERVLGALPFFHTWGLSCVVVATVAVGGTIVLTEGLDARDIVEHIRDARVTVVYGSATFLHRLLDAAGDDASELLGGLRYVKAGAMLVGGDLPRRWAEAVPDVPLRLGYGLTEASPEVCGEPPHAPVAGTVGVPLPSTEVRVCDPTEPDRVLPAGEEGELQVRGPQVTSGYLDRPDATAAAFAAGSWLRTGDLGTLDEQGYVRVLDRLKDLIKFRGWSVVPGEVEAVLRDHPAVAEAVVVGVPDPRDGERPVAHVVLRPGHDLGTAIADTLTTHVTDRLAPYKRPRAIVFRDTIPKNAVGKPLRRVLRDEGQAQEG